MKRATESLALKIGAVALILLLLIMLIFSAGGVLLLLGENGYVDDGATLRRSAAERFMSNMSSNLAWYYENADIDAESWHDTQALENGDWLSDTYNLQDYKPENTNFRFAILNEEGEVISQNAPCDDAMYTRRDIFWFQREETEQQVYTFDSLDDLNGFLTANLLVSDDTTVTLEEMTNSSTGEVMWYVAYVDKTYYEDIGITVVSAVPSELTVKDALYVSLYWVDWLVSVRMWLIAAAVVSLLGTVLLGIYLLCAVGHKAGEEGIYLNWMNRIPLDLYAAVLAAAALVPLIFLMNEITYSHSAVAALDPLTSLGITVVALWIAIMLLMLVLSFAARCKAGAWWRNTLIYRLLHGLWWLLCAMGRGLKYLLTSLPTVVKTALALAAAGVYTLIMIAWDDIAPRVLMWLLLAVVAVPAVLYFAVGLRRLQKRQQELAGGNLGGQMETGRLYGELRGAAETLNRIGGGMTEAVNERMKSERMKTELITNVSHDIKTPLTSIINYVDLLKKEEPESETMREYLAVLDRQSARLKKLIEDLVEASKASTGSLSVELVPCEAGILLTQMVGEYEERAAAQELTLLLHQPEEPVCILADVRHLGRVFDNLMNNVCKYSQPGTRVYLTLERQGEQAVITFRNISRVPLNVSGDELMERFVRGDSSRNTEGSGLGLSIARSLTELQGGAMNLVVDGDLFKVILTFRLTAAPGFHINESQKG